MKTALLNGKIYIEKDFFKEAVLIENGLFCKVGTNEEIRNEINDQTEIIDLEGRTVIPGLNDSHLHICLMAERMAQVDLTKAKSIDEIVELCKIYMKEKPELTASGIMASGWNQDLFTQGEKRYLNRHDLDKISTEIPIVLIRVCGHVIAANTVAIKKSGIWKDFLAGAKVDIGDDDFPTGVFAENVRYKLQSLVPPLTKTQMEEFVVKALEKAMKAGLTTVQSNDVGLCQLGDQETFDLIYKLFVDGKIPIRYRHQLCFHTVDKLQEYLSGEFTSNRYSEYSDYLSLGPLKLFKDGSIGGRTAMMEKGYCDSPEEFGVDVTNNSEMEEIMRLAVLNEMQTITHAIGDKAITDTLEVYSKFINQGKNSLRHSIVHFQCTNPDILKKTAELNVHIQVQPVFLNTDIQAVKTRLTREDCRWFLALKSNLKEKIRMSFSSDSPIEDCNPFYSIYCAVARKDLDGNPVAGFYDEECIDVATAIDCFTSGSAYQEFQEEKKGRIKEGMLADVVVLDTDIFSCPVEEIKKIVPVMTIVGGKTVYRA